jgi:hypothetical protein
MKLQGDCGALETQTYSIRIGDQNTVIHVLDKKK